MNTYLNQVPKFLKKRQIHILPLKYLQSEFPQLVSYNRFVELMPCALIPLICYLNTRKGEVTGPDLVQEIVGKIFGDKGYISSDLFKELLALRYLLCQD